MRLSQRWMFGSDNEWGIPLMMDTPITLKGVVPFNFVKSSKVDKHERGQI